MRLDPTFTSTEVGISVLVVIFAILFLTIFFRLKANGIDVDTIKSKYLGKKGKSPLDGRNKYPDVDINRYRNLIWNVSLAITLGLIISLLGWTNYEKRVEVMSYSLEIDETIEIEPPRTQDPPPPPPPPPPSVVVEAVSEELLEEEEVEFLDQSIDEETLVEAPPPTEKPKEVAPPPPPPPPPPEEVDVAEIFKVVEEMPSFPGCNNITDKKEKRACSDKKLYEYVFSNIQYPTIARENGVEGMVYVQFVVEPDGSISNARVVRDIGAGCGEEALRMVKGMNDMSEKWSPGKQRGRPVRVIYTLPVKFQLIT